MKIKLHLLYLAFLFPFSLFSQDFVNTSNKWYITDCCFIQGAIDCFTYEYQFGEIITIDNLDYRELITDNINAIFPFGQFYREEGGRVYMKHSENEPEFMIYDFNLEPGQAVEILGPNNTLELQVVDVDSIVLNSGEKRKRIIFDENFSEERYWIEGIGSKVAPMNTEYMNTFDCWIDLSCFFIQDSIEFQLGTCELGGSSANSEIEKTGSSLSISPNPTDGILKINTDINQINKLEIYDTKGIKCLALNSINDSSLNVDFLVQGLYFVVIYFEDGKTGKGRFIRK